MKQNKQTNVKITQKSKGRSSAKSAGNTSARTPKKSGNHKKMFEVDIGGSFGPAKGSFKAKYKPERSMSNTLSPSATPGNSNSAGIRRCSDRFRFGEFTDDGSTVIGPNAENQILLNVPVNMRRIVEAARILSNATAPYASDPFIESSYQFQLEAARVLLEFTAPDSISGTVAMFVTSNGDDVITPQNVLSIYSSLPANAKCEVDTKMTKQVSFKCGLTYLQEDPATPQFDPRLVFGGYIVVFVKMPFVAGLAAEPGRAYLGPICSTEMRVDAVYHGFQYGRTGDNDRATPTSHQVRYELPYVPGLAPSEVRVDGGRESNVWQACFLADAELSAALAATSDRMRSHGQILGSTGSISEHVRTLERGPRPTFTSDGANIPIVQLNTPEGVIPGACATAEFIDNGRYLNSFKSPPVDIQYALFNGNWIVRVFNSTGYKGPWHDNGMPYNSDFNQIKQGSEVASKNVQTFFHGEDVNVDGNQPLFIASNRTDPAPRVVINLWMESIGQSLYVKSTYGQPISTTPPVARYAFNRLTPTASRLADVRTTWLQRAYQHVLQRVDGDLFLNGEPFTLTNLPHSWGARHYTDGSTSFAWIRGAITIPSRSLTGPCSLFIIFSPDPHVEYGVVEQQFGLNCNMSGVEDFEMFAVGYQDQANNPNLVPVARPRHTPDDGVVHYDGGVIPPNMAVTNGPNGPILVSLKAMNPDPCMFTKQKYT